MPDPWPLSDPGGFCVGLFGSEGFPGGFDFGSGCIWRSGLCSSLVLMVFNLWNVTGIHCRGPYASDLQAANKVSAPAMCVVVVLQFAGHGPKWEASYAVYRSYPAIPRACDDAEYCRRRAKR